MKIEGRTAQRLSTLKAKISHLKERDGVFLARGSTVACNLYLGRGTRINGPAFFRGRGSVTFGNYCAVGHGLIIATSNHSFSRPAIQHHLLSTLGISVTDTPDPVEIGHDVWIGDRVTILPGVKIGDGAVIGAGAIVTKPVSEYEVWAGVPAARIGKRFSDEVRGVLKQIRWWDLPDSELLGRKSFFEADLRNLTGKEVFDIWRSVTPHE